MNLKTSLRASSTNGVVTKNATVFPVPVFAFARTSLPAI